MSLAQVVDKTHKGMVDKAKGKKSVKHVEVHKADGGYITRTHYNHTGGEYHEPDEAIHKTLGSVKKHLGQCMDDEKGEKE